jgi:hypothetical protein
MLSINSDTEQHDQRNHTRNGAKLFVLVRVISRIVLFRRRPKEGRDREGRMLVFPLLFILQDEVHSPCADGSLPH